MMTENLLQINSIGTIQDKFATEKDKKKAYQIFLLSGIFSTILTAGLYYIATMI